MTRTKLSILLLGLLVVIASGQVMAQTTTGTVRAGYVFTDHEGNRSMDQTAYNIHEGLALSLEDLRHDFTSGPPFHDASSSSSTSCPPRSAET